jgi:hypothetical protein
MGDNGAFAPSMRRIGRPLAIVYTQTDTAAGFIFATSSNTATDTYAATAAKSACTIGEHVDEYNPHSQNNGPYTVEKCKGEGYEYGW